MIRLDTYFWRGGASTTKQFVYVSPRNFGVKMNPMVGGPTFLSSCVIKTPKTHTRWWFQIFFYVHPYLGNIPILTNIFQMGWNHQPDIDLAENNKFGAKTNIQKLA